MSMVTATPRSSPSEEELDELYNSVLSGFANERPAPYTVGFQPLNDSGVRWGSFANGHSSGVTTGPLSVSTQDNSQGTNSYSLQSPLSSYSPGQERPSRPFPRALPPIPSTSHSPAPLPKSLPEPGHSTQPSVNSIQPSVSSTQQNPTSNNVSTVRRLPQAPEERICNINPRRSIRRPLRQSTGRRSTILGLPNILVDPTLLIDTNVGSSLPHDVHMYSAVDSHEGTLRPRGAQTPVIPGHSEVRHDRGPYASSAPAYSSSQTFLPSGTIAHSTQGTTTHDEACTTPTTPRPSQEISSPHPRSLVPGAYRPLPSPVQPVHDWQTFSTPAELQNSRNRTPNEMIPSQTIGLPLEMHNNDEDEDEDDDSRFFNLALLSHIAVRLQDQVPRGTHVKGGISYARSFTGKDIVSTIHAQIQDELLLMIGVCTIDHHLVQEVANSLQTQLFFYDVEWAGRSFQGGTGDIYMFLDDPEDNDGAIESAELPTGIFPALAYCYSPSCVEGLACYSYACPLRIPSKVETLAAKNTPSVSIDPSILQNLPENDINRQTMLRFAITAEEEYIRDLELIESLFMKPLRSATPPLISPDQLDDFVNDVFGNILDIRKCNSNLLQSLTARQREQHPVVETIGDIFLLAATEFRTAYPTYIAHLPNAQKRYKNELEHNPRFRKWLENQEHHSYAHRHDLKYFLNRPSEHLQKYARNFQAVLKETEQANPDRDFLLEATQSIYKLSAMVQLKTFQNAMGKDEKHDWHDFVTPEDFSSLPDKERKRQPIIFELISTEMGYVTDLENFNQMYIRPLQIADPPIIPHDRLQTFINAVFHNFEELLTLHRKLLRRLHEVQLDEHPTIRSVSTPLLDAVVEWGDAYMKYVTNYPIACHHIEEEVASNPAFKGFLDSTTRIPDARKLDMQTFIHLPIPRLLRYELLLKNILKETPDDHEDIIFIPRIIDVLKALGKGTEVGIATSTEKAAILRYQSNLVFKPGEAADMDLLNENRALIHTGKLQRHADSGIDWSGGTSYFVLLFDNYLVFTKEKDKDGVTKYNVIGKPVPLDLFTSSFFNAPPPQRGMLGLFAGDKHMEQSAPGGLGAAKSEVAGSLFLCIIPHHARPGVYWTVYAESVQDLLLWKEKLEGAITQHKGPGWKSLSPSICAGELPS